MDEATRRELERRTEGWFVRQGLPHLIDDYRASTDVWTRAAPFLTLVFVAEVFFTLDEDREGWAEVLPFLGGVVVLAGAAAAINRFRGRRLFQRPDRVGVLELTAFVLVPPLLPALFSGDPLYDSIGLLTANLVIVGATYVVTSYGLVPMSRWAAGQMFRQFGDLAHLLARSLPLLLLFATLVFLNAEIWQVAADFEGPYLAITVGMLFAAGLAFVLFRLPREVDEMSRFGSWREVHRLTATTPVAAVSTGDGGEVPAEAGLDRPGRTNVALVLVVSQGFQILLVAVIIGLFYVAFGLFTVREATIVQWTTNATPDVIARWTVFGNEVVLSWELVKVAVFIAAFSGLQVTVAAVTDEAYRKAFLDDLLVEVRKALAVRAVYLHRLRPVTDGDGATLVTESGPAGGPVRGSG